MDTDRLAEIAIELARRVRDDPDDAADWLRDTASPDELWALHFVQASVGPTTPAGFRRRLAWVAPDTVDDIAVELACRGEPVHLNRLEQAAAVKRLYRRGVSIRETARRVGVGRRWVSRIRGDQVKYAREVA